MRIELSLGTWWVTVRKCSPTCVLAGQPDDCCTRSSAGVRRRPLRGHAIGHVAGTTPSACTLRAHAAHDGNVHGDRARTCVDVSRAAPAPTRCPGRPRTVAVRGPEWARDGHEARVLTNRTGPAGMPSGRVAPTRARPRDVPSEVRPAGRGRCAAVRPQRNATDIGLTVPTRATNVGSGRLGVRDTCITA